MNNIFKLGFIGGGINSAVGTTHFIASQMDNRFKVAAGCLSRHPEVNHQTADTWGIASERRYSDIDSLLKEEKGQIDAIVVLTPTPDHTEPVIKALRNGYPVICEKALASSSIDGRMIKKEQIKHNGFLAVTYNYTGYPMLRELRHKIRRGDFGRIEQVHIEMPQEGYARLNRDCQPMTPQQWRLRDAELPTLSLDLGTHLHNIIDFLTGEKPRELVSLQSTKGKFRQVIDNTMCIASYSNELECSIWFSKSALGHRNGLWVRVYGESASAEWYQMEPEHLVVHDNKGRKIFVDRANIDVVVAPEVRYNRFKSGHPAGFIEAFANLYCDIADSLEKYRDLGHQGETDYVFSATHAIEGLLMLEAMSQSSKEHDWKQVNLSGY